MRFKVGVGDVSGSRIRRFFGVALLLRTWLNCVYLCLALPLGIFYCVFLTVGLFLGVGLVIVWIGIPILMVVVGSWWLFSALERILARGLLGADVGPAPRAWETVDGVWAKLKAHFSSSSTWIDLVFLLAKLPFGVLSFTLLATGAGIVGWLLALPIAAVADLTVVGTWVPPLWVGVLAAPAGVLLFFAVLHALNAWAWVCARWAEALFGPVSVARVRSAPAAGSLVPLVEVTRRPEAPAPPDSTDR